MQSSQQSTTEQGHALAGKYLTFRLGAEEYGIGILKVREIIGLMDVTPVPRSPEHIKGVINLRGRIIPVLDLRTRFGMDAFEGTEESCIIVLDVSVDGVVTNMGVLVDGVCEVLDIAADEIDPPPPLGGSSGAGFMLGIAKSRGDVRILLDSDRILHSGDTASLAELHEARSA